MAYNRANLIRRYIDVQRCTQEHYEEGITSYKGIWRKYIEPRFHYSYQQYINILGMGGLAAELEALGRAKESKPAAGARQLELLDMPGVDSNPEK